MMEQYNVKQADKPETFEEKAISYYINLRNKYPIGSTYWLMFTCMAEALKGKK